MSNSEPFDPNLGHRYFSADYFNRVWGLLDKTDRTPEEAEQMLSMSHASLAHWRDREDCGSRELSVGYWQLSRVYAVLGKAEPAGNYANLCLEASEGESAFYLGFAYEALARATKLAGDHAAAADHLDIAREQLAKVEDPGDRKILEADLDALANDDG